MGFPYTNVSDSGRGIDRYLKVLSDNLKTIHNKIDIIESGVVRPKISNLLVSILELIRKTIKTDSKIYHAVDPMGFFILKLFFKKPVVLTIHDTIPLSGGIKENGPRVFLTKFLMKFGIRFSERIIVPFEYTKDELISIFHKRPSKIMVVKYGIDFPNLEHNTLRLNFDPHNTNNFKILFIGSGNPNKRGLEMVFRTYKEVKQNYEVSLTIVGKREEIMITLDKFEELRDDVDITIHDFVPEDHLYEFISEYDAFLYPSKLGFSFLVVQAMFVGVPTIVANTRDMNEYVGDSGFCCSPLDLNCYVSAIIQLINNQSVRNKIVRNGVEKAQSFSGLLMANNTNVVYNSMKEN